MLLISSRYYMDKLKLKQTIHQIVTDHLECDPNIYTDLNIFERLEIIKTDNEQQCCFMLTNYQSRQHPVLIIMKNGAFFYHETAHYVTGVSSLFDFLLMKNNNLEYFCVKDLLYYFVAYVLDIDPHKKEIDDSILDDFIESGSCLEPCLGPEHNPNNKTEQINTKETSIENTTMFPNADAWSGYYFILNEAFSKYAEFVYDSHDLSRYSLENYLGRKEIFPEEVPDNENRLFCDFRDKVLIPLKENKTYDLDTMRRFGIEFHYLPDSCLIHELGFMLAKKISDNLTDNKITKHEIGKYFIKDLIEFSLFRYNYSNILNWKHGDDSQNQIKIIKDAFKSRKEYIKKRKQYFSSIKDIGMCSTELKYNPMKTFIELYMI